METSDFPRITRLPPSVSNSVGDLKQKARRAGEDINETLGSTGAGTIRKAG